MTTDQQQGLSVATKLFRILAAFTADHPRLRASEVCRRSGLPFSTVHRILTELVSHGVLDHAPDGTYAVGIRLWEVATLNPQVASLRGVATPWMHELYSMLRCRVCLDVRVGVQGLRVEELNGVGVHSCHRLGTRFPIRSTVGGHVLLAYAGSQVLEAVLAAPPTRPVEDDVIYPHGLRQGLASIRGSGVAVSESQSHVTVAGPVFGPAGGIVAALEVDAPAPDDLLRLVAAVRCACTEMSQAFRRSRQVQPHLTARDRSRSDTPRLISKLLPIQWVPPGQHQRSIRDS